MALIAAAAIAGTAALGGSLLSSSAAKSAASQQANAATNAANLENQQYQTTRQDLIPYNTAGQSLLGPLSSQYLNTGNALGAAFNNAQGSMPQQITAQNINQLPGYQFNLSQGENAVNNAAAARGLGESSTDFNNASNFATGLANQYANDYFNRGQTLFSDANTQFGNANTLETTLYNQLYGPTALGENAGAQTGNIGSSLAQAQGGQIAAAGQAQAAGTAASGQALANGLGTVGNSISQYMLLNNILTNSNGLGTTTGVGSNGWGAGSSGTQPFGGGNQY